MDANTVLEDYLSDVTNLPTDLAFIFDEIHGNEEKLREVQKKAQQKDIVNQKFLKMHGPLAENPKETASYPRIRAELQQALAIQEDKCNLANTGLYIISRYVKRLDDQIRTLEREGAIPVAHTENVSKGFIPTKRKTGSDRKSMSRTSTPAYSTRSNGVGASPHGTARTHTATTGERLLRRQRVSEEADEEKYCICNGKSFGDMIGCDNDNCPHEWFHWECVGLTETPSGVWYCPTCRKK